MTNNFLKETVRGIMPVSIEDGLYSNRREIFFNEEFNTETCNMLLKALMFLESENHEEIKIFIDSPGGMITPGLAVYDYILSMESPVTTIVTGLAASMGSILFLAGTKDRLMFPHAKVMVHAPSYGKHDIGGMKPDEVQEELDRLKETRLITDGIIAERTGKSLEEIAEISKKDTYFTAEEAINYGIATGKACDRKDK